MKLQNLTNLKFNRLRVIERTKDSKWRCICECGKIVAVKSGDLKNGHTKSCGCLQKEITSKNSQIDHTGKKFNKLLVLKRINSKPLTKYLCKCDCGEETIVNGGSLISNHTKSCGCLKANKFIRSHKLYDTWHSMKSRCKNKGHTSYKYYGKRGIKVCERWKSSFLLFLEDMGEKPSDKLSIDRINNDGNYSCGKCNECIQNNWPMNCRWATNKEQANNQRRNKN